MQVTDFLITKAESSYLLESFTLRQALEKMEYHRYTAMPVLNNDGYYLYTLFVDDCLWVFKNSPNLRFIDAEKIPVSSIKTTREVQPVNISAQLGELLHKSVEQNFIPVVDDLGVYIGLVRRKDLIEYCRPLLLRRLRAENNYISEKHV
ncbi:MAG TPA: CBS domain-containing protein [Candidatus Avidehalobacter gallistercoris]|uniref:CBS domain-containing protein n=1 Tax=Candidatus Avidehalobacter gallistercoris TaxID=2840694 RepID=A0A9D1KYX2_9FIRM|nr:CBS domain-containing protein [Candidatus Avidehalobacter gallistercoris]